VIEDELKVPIGNKRENRNYTLFKWTKEGDPEDAIEDFEHNLSLLIYTIKKHAPVKRPCKWSKSWWTPELTQLGKDFTFKTRKAKEDPEVVDDAKHAKKKYQNEVKKARAIHRRTFLENAKKNDMWTPHQFMKKRLGSTVPGGHNYPCAASLNLAIMQYFFPPNPNPVDMEPPRYIELEERDIVDASEVAQALCNCSNTSAPGPDQVPYGVWKGIHSVNHYIIPALINHMLRWSIHPPSLKDSLGILLPKPSKGDYDAFASYRVIALMQTFSKIAERIINQRLIKFAKANGLYSIRQTGSLPQCVTGVLCRKTDPRIATAPKTQSRSKDQNKDKNNSK